MEKIRVGVITVSDGCSLNDEVDVVGAELVRLINQGNLRRSEVVKACVLPEDINSIERKVTEWCNIDNLHLIFTIGGLNGNNVKRAISSLLERQLPGIVKLMQSIPFREHDNIISGFRQQSVIVTLPDDMIILRRCLKLTEDSIRHSIFILTGFGQVIPGEFQ